MPFSIKFNDFSCHCEGLGDFGQTVLFADSVDYEASYTMYAKKLDLFHEEKKKNTINNG